jgi:hypothetical protein
MLMQRLLIRSPIAAKPAIPLRPSFGHSLDKRNVKYDRAACSQLNKNRIVQVDHRKQSSDGTADLKQGLRAYCRRHRDWVASTEL